MTKCEYCEKEGLFDDGKHCRIHRGQNIAIIPVSIYCSKCNTSVPINCPNEECKLVNRVHLCPKCDECQCNIEDDPHRKKYGYYKSCQCFHICSDCILNKKHLE